ncbi:protein TonB-like isoform X4 [Crotalus tigris]|uniref:protein TonB-like isoform X4 n=1 Tax=Crotalus tigris TaxID=88082 RepID=UPI00192F5BC1|nr:protein TonB-like isoform X4 [Crotalus tigris]
MQVEPPEEKVYISHVWKKEPVFLLVDTTERSQEIPQPPPVEITELMPPPPAEAEAEALALAPAPAPAPEPVKKASSKKLSEKETPTSETSPKTESEKESPTSETSPKTEMGG